MEWWKRNSEISLLCHCRLVTTDDIVNTEQKKRQRKKPCKLLPGLRKISESALVTENACGHQHSSSITEELGSYARKQWHNRQHGFSDSNTTISSAPTVTVHKLITAMECDSWLCFLLLVKGPEIQSWSLRHRYHPMSFYLWETFWYNFLQYCFIALVEEHTVHRTEYSGLILIYCRNASSSFP